MYVEWDVNEIMYLSFIPFLLHFVSITHSLVRSINHLLTILLNIIFLFILILFSYYLFYFYIHFIIIACIFYIVITFTYIHGYCACHLYFQNETNRMG